MSEQEGLEFCEWIPVLLFVYSKHRIGTRRIGNLSMLLLR